jgi:hypothetical protein
MNYIAWFNFREQSLSSFLSFSSSGLRLPLSEKGAFGDFLYFVTHPCIV